MKKIMHVADAFSTKDGLTVIAGADHGLDDLDKKKIEAIFGESIVLEPIDGFPTDSIRVLGFDTSESLIGKKNVFLKLDVLFQKANDFLGSAVFVSAQESEH